MKTNKRSFAVLVLTVMAGASAYASVWVGGGPDNEFSTAGNWDDGGINGTQDIDGNVTVERVVDNTCSRTFVSGGATLNVTGGTHNDNLTGATRWNFVGNGSAGTVNQSGGSYSIGHGLRIGTGNSVNSDGAYYLTAGSLAVYRGSNSGIEPSNPGGRPSMEIGGLTAGTGRFEILAGSLETRGGVHIGGTGTFSVLGSAATSIGIGSNQNGDGTWIQKAGGTLMVGIDGGGCTGILIDEVDGDGDQQVTFEAGALLDVDYYNGGTNSGTWTVMELENADIVDGGLTFAAGVDTNIWSFNIDNSGANGILAVTAAGDSPVTSKFAHPGIWHKRSDLDRMKHMVEAGIDPWHASFLTLSGENSASYNYTVRKDPFDNTLSRENPSHQRYQYEDDAIAAYHNSLMWYITGDSRHADKAIEILNAWSSLTNFYGGGTEPLCAGLYGSPLINAAEIIKSTYTGWAEQDIQNFKDMLVHPGYSNTTVPTSDISNDNVTFYWRTYMGDPGRHGNQGLLAWRTVMAIGIFLDNEIIYDRALNNIIGLPHRSDDLPYPSGPPNTSSTPSHPCAYYDEYTLYGRYTTIPDYGYDDSIQHYIYDNGQCQESSRDQVHSSLGIGAITEMMEVAWNQGTDIWSFLDYRVLDGLEFTLKYNLSDEQYFVDQPTPWEPPLFYQVTSRCGRWTSLQINPHVTCDTSRYSRGDNVVLRPTLEIPAAHFTVREDMANQATWLLRSRDYAIGEQGYEEEDGTASAGWGGLSYRRPDFCAGDPIQGISFGIPDYGMHVLPGTIEAENYDFFSGTAEGRTYHDLTSTNTGGAYRPDDGVDITTCSEGGYALTSLEADEWITYTVAIPSNNAYEIVLRYAASAAGGKVKVSFGGVDMTGDVTLPYGAPYSTGPTDWRDYIIATDVPLARGVKSMKISFSGLSDAFELNSLSVIQVGGAPVFGYDVSTLTSAAAPAVSSNDLAQTQYLSSSATGGNPPSDHAELFNGLIGDEDNNTVDPGEVSLASDNTLKVTFDTSVNTLGYDLTEIKTYFGWNTDDGGRANQGYEILLTFVDDTIASLAGPVHWEPNSPAAYWTTVAFEGDPGGVLASGVKAVTFDITEDANAGGVVVGREFDIFGVPTDSASPFSPGFPSDGAVSNGLLFTQLSGVVGENYRLEWKADLMDPNPWQVVTNLGTLSISPLDVSVPATNDASFFRARWMP